MCLEKILQLHRRKGRVGVCLDLSPQDTLLACGKWRFIFGIPEPKGLNPWHQTQGSMKEFGIGNDSRGWQVFSTSWQQNNKLHCNTRCLSDWINSPGFGVKIKNIQNTTLYVDSCWFFKENSKRNIHPIWIYIPSNLRRHWPGIPRLPLTWSFMSSWWWQEIFASWGFIWAVIKTHQWHSSRMVV